MITEVTKEIIRNQSIKKKAPTTEKWKYFLHIRHSETLQPLPEMLWKPKLKKFIN